MPPVHTRTGPSPLTSPARAHPRKTPSRSGGRRGLLRTLAESYCRTNPLKHLRTGGLRIPTSTWVGGSVVLRMAGSTARCSFSAVSVDRRDEPPARRRGLLVCARNVARATRGPCTVRRSRSLKVCPCAMPTRRWRCGRCSKITPAPVIGGEDSACCKVPRKVARLCSRTLSDDVAKGSRHPSERKAALRVMHAAGGSAQVRCGRLAPSDPDVAGLPAMWL